jgi:hypothetical protein
MKAFTNNWIGKWQRNGWRSAGKQPVKNRDLWEMLIAEVDRRRVRWHKVKAHSGVELNERCDELAAAACFGTTSEPVAVNVDVEALALVDGSNGDARPWGLLMSRTQVEWLVRELRKLDDSDATLVRVGRRPRRGLVVEVVRGGADRRSYELAVLGDQAEEQS